MDNAGMISLGHQIITRDFNIMNTSDLTQSNVVFNLTIIKVVIGYSVSNVMKWSVDGSADKNHGSGVDGQLAASHGENSGETVAPTKLSWRGHLFGGTNLEVETPLNTLDFKDSIVIGHPVATVAPFGMFSGAAAQMNSILRDLHSLYTIYISISHYYKANTESAMIQRPSDDHRNHQIIISA
ncbi:hypothetical protein Scep_028581 [Stephania cephalantha]|uniref:Uncharacterized protein n=1 Tax=Stephania cephalantha TaxID=152367 RepID=A0AAP0EIL0_9MAGN